MVLLAIRYKIAAPVREIRKPLGWNGIWFSQFQARSEHDLAAFVSLFVHGLSVLKLPVRYVKVSP
jgi:hypothetical protein